MKISHLLITRMTAGLALLPSIGCVNQTQETETNPGDTDSVKTSLENTSDSLTHCPPLSDSLKTDTSNTEGTLTISADYCPPCGMG